jgi:predicted CXXCH cytochrome family protein
VDAILERRDMEAGHAGRPGPALTIALAITLSGLLAAASALAAGPLPRPSRAASVVEEILGRGPHAGECERCHTTHGGSDLPQQYALVGPDDNSLCASCHTEPWKGGSYGDIWSYTRSSHGVDPAAVWPGPDPVGRTEPDAAGKCLNCHDPHGWTDNLGDIPHLAIAREEALCLRCHDGGPATTIVSVDFAKPYAHPTGRVSGVHKNAAESFSSDFGAAPENRRHAECEDCHNPHIAHRDENGPPSAPDLSRRNLGVSRVRPESAPAGVPRTFTFIAGSDTVSTPVAEYQLCYKCHSSWTVQPGGQTDLAAALNPANPSYHPVEATGRDLSIRLGAFAPGWTASSLTACGDCHGSDYEGSRGTHGSNYEYILKKPYKPSPLPRMMGSDESCFSCHSYEVYANGSASEAVQGESRFNAPGATVGHAGHVGSNDVPCGACHVTHGSATQSHLIVTGRIPGIVSFTETPTGGTCTATCHGPATYAVNYAR